MHRIKEVYPLIPVAWDGDFQYFDVWCFLFLFVCFCFCLFVLFLKSMTQLSDLTEKENKDFGCSSRVITSARPDLKYAIFVCLFVCFLTVYFQIQVEFFYGTDVGRGRVGGWESFIS